VGNLPLKNVQIQYISDENVRLVNSGNPPGQASDGGSVLTWVAPQMNPGDALLITLDLEAAPQPTSNKVEHQIRIDTDRGSDSYNIELDIIDGPAANGNFGARAPGGNGGFGGASPVDPAAPTAAGTLAAKVQAPQVVTAFDTIDYVLTVKNNNINSFRDIGVTMQIAEQMEFISTSAPPGIQTRSSPDGLIIEFAPLRELPSGQDIVYRAKARAKVAGTARFLGSVNAIGVKQLIVGAETKVN